MAFDEKLAGMVREIISLTHKNIEEKRMFGGLCFMVYDKMWVGVETSRLMVGFDPVKADEVMDMEGTSLMDFTNKIMKGFAFVDIAALNTKKKLEYWITLALEYNKLAKPSKKRKKRSNPFS